MERRPIEIRKGSIPPSKTTAWARAAAKLEEAAASISEMKSVMAEGRDREAYERRWGQFVDCIEEFWSSFFDEGKTISTKFQPWAGDLDAKRRADPLLEYLIEARHQSQHGRVALQWAGGKLEIAPGFTGIIKKFAAFPDQTYIIDSTPADPSVPEAKVVLSGWEPSLRPIVNMKSKRSISPPTKHFDFNLAGKRPHEMAELALGHYRSVLEQACLKFL